ncbi:MAG: helix-turn-helix transcriptional regulator [Gammaproteobacteria bacterium]|nr:helix-turn-helix transcriptional regulator [Gammaproteobacteria bacterium]
MGEAAKVVRQERRVRTEAAMLDAFETVLVREGADNVTVQAVADEAGVAKTLIYRYFDDIGGLIKTWGRERTLFVPLDELFPDPQASAAALHNDPFGFAKNQILKQAQHMRNHPAYVELCLAELSGSGPVVDALMELRLQRNEDESKALGVTLDGSTVPLLLPLLLLPAAITYLAMRARKSPVYAGGIRLDSDEGWAQIMGAVEQTLDLLSAAAKLAELTNADPQQLAANFMQGERE